MEDETLKQIKKDTKKDPNTIKVRQIIATFQLVFGEIVAVAKWTFLSKMLDSFDAQSFYLN